MSETWRTGQDVYVTAFLSCEERVTVLLGKKIMVTTPLGPCCIQLSKPQLSMHKLPMWLRVRKVMSAALPGCTVHSAWLNVLTLAHTADFAVAWHLQAIPVCCTSTGAVV